MQLRVRGVTRDWSDWAGFVFWSISVLCLLARVGGLALLFLPSILHEALVAASFLLRHRRRAQLSGIAPRLAAYAGTFLIPAFVTYSQLAHLGWLQLTSVKALVTGGFLLWVVGCLFGVWGVWHLRYAFGIEPQARELVVTGPYRCARHPIYAAYALQYTGIWTMAGFSGGFALPLLTWLALIIMRIHFEEKVLCATFPEYAAYRAAVGMFGPRLMSWRLSRTGPPPATLPAQETWRPELRGIR